MEHSSICSLIRLRGHSSQVNSVVFSPNEDYLVSGSWDTTIGVWSVSTGDLINTFSGHLETVKTLIF